MCAVLFFYLRFFGLAGVCMCGLMVIGEGSVYGNFGDKYEYRYRYVGRQGMDVDRH